MTVASWGTMIMSGRGTITSRATVSPNSMMLSMSSRSSCSMTSSLAAASTMPSSSRSETNGPSLMPLPGRIQLAKAISAWVTMRSGQNLTSHERRPGGEQGGLLAVQHRPRLGDGLGEDEQDHDVEHEAEDGTPRARTAG